MSQTSGKKDEDKKPAEEKKADKPAEEKKPEGEDKDKKPEDKDKKPEGDEKKCDNNCTGEKVAAVLQAPGKIPGMIQDAVKNKFKNVTKKIADDMKDRRKCMAVAVTQELPKIIPMVISGIGSSTAGAFNDITDSIKNLFLELGSRKVNGYPNIFGPLEVGYAIIIINLQNIINKIILGADANKILGDPNMDSKKLFDKMMRTSKRYKNAVEEAEFRGVFKEWIGNYIDALLKTIDIAQPDIDRINHKLKEIIEGMGSNIGASISHALVNVIKSVLANVPVVGGITSAITSVDQLAQEIIKTCRPPIVDGAGIILPVVNGLKKEKCKLESELNKLAKKIEPIIHQTGGAKNYNKKIQHTTKRVNYLLGRFTAQKQKTNYTRRLHQSRC
jgi:hypothetical protein